MLNYLNNLDTLDLEMREINEITQLLLIGMEEYDHVVRDYPLRGV